MTTAAQQEIRELAASNPAYSDAILPELEGGGRVPLSRVPRDVRDWALRWMRTVVRSEWLPPNLAAVLSAAKDLRQVEDRHKGHAWYGGRIADVVAAHYMKKGLRFHLSDNGATVGVRVDLPDSVDLRQDGGQQVRQWIERYLNVPPGTRLGDEAFLQHDGDIVHGVLVSDAREIDWWKRITVVSNGRFVFLSCGEPLAIEGTTELRERAVIGVPDRF